MKRIILVLAFASCEGRCRAQDAVSDEVPGAMCAASLSAEHGICVRGDEVFTCSIQGLIWHTATCSQAGVMKP